MSKTKCTKLPWIVKSELTIKGADGYELCSIPECDGDEGGRPEEDRANAKRIVECVNACAGIANPAQIQHLISDLLAFAEERTEVGVWARTMLATLGGFAPVKEISDASH